MTVADKYMSEANSSFKFIPPRFDKNLFINQDFVRQEEILNLFPSETEQQQMHCYYNELSGCKNAKTEIMRCEKDECETEDAIVVKIPTPSEILRNYNFAEENNMNGDGEVEEICKYISENNHSVIDTLTEYKIPIPIAKHKTKKIVRLSVQYSKECNKL